LEFIDTTDDQTLLAKLGLATAIDAVTAARQPDYSTGFELNTATAGIEYDTISTLQ
jgi:hypothetical protein